MRPFPWEAAMQFGQSIDALAEPGGILDQGGDVTEQDALLGIVGDRADERFEVEHGVPGKAKSDSEWQRGTCVTSPVGYRLLDIRYFRTTSLRATEPAR